MDVVMEQSTQYWSGDGAKCPVSEEQVRAKSSEHLFGPHLRIKSPRREQVDFEKVIHPSYDECLRR